MAEPRWRAPIAAGLLILAASAAAGAEADRVTFAGRSASATVANGGYTLNAAGREIAIDAQAAKSDTGSVLLDALFALAQAELAQARVAQITDGAFNHGQPLPCVCLETGAKWPYVWTRDLAYATDLALFRFDPQRARNGLEFKLSPPRGAASQPSGRDHLDAQPLYVVQDTGSGGSWPVSTDRIVWFLGARHLFDDARFGDDARRALAATLEQDRRYAFDDARGLYRGETSFLDWREQSYPAWTADDVVFIAQSFALSTNVLHYMALQLAADTAAARGETADHWRAQAAALKIAIDRAFWRTDRGLYMSYVGGAGAPQVIEAYDLLGTALAIVGGVAPPEHARRALANYPTTEAGSPVIWPERRDVPIYHNRAIWPFVSAYALKAARALDDPARIAHELRSILRGAAFAGSNMENYEFTTLATHVEDGARSGPVVNSPRQLWSVAAFLDLVVEGVFGLNERDAIEPKIPRELLPLLFGERKEIRLELAQRRITLVRPEKLDPEANLLIAGRIDGPPQDRRVQLRGVHVAASPLPLGRPAFAPATPASVQAVREHGRWRVTSAAPERLRLYVEGRYRTTFTHATLLPARAQRQCLSVTVRDAAGVESLPSRPVCVGAYDAVGGAWPRTWAATRAGRFAVQLDYRNAHGPINTGITAAVKQLTIACGNAATTVPLVMPHSVREEASTAATFAARAGDRCTFALADGFNMSLLEHYARYTGGQGGADGALNDADYGELRIVPVATGAGTR